MTSLPKKIHLGFTILLLTVTLLLISTLLILFTAQYSNLQQKITTNIYRNQQAFEAAEAGLEAAIPYFMSNYAAIVANESGGFLQPYLNAITHNVGLADGSEYSFVFSNPTANNYQLITITATGTNADGTATRTIVQQIQSYSSGPPTPNYTLTTKGSLSFTNSASVNNAQTNANINAGGSVTFTNSAATTTSQGVSSNSSHLGSDVQENNNSLSSMTNAAFFQSIFGVNSTTVQNAANYNYSNSTNKNYNNLNGVTGAVIWITQTNGSTAQISNSTTIGSAAHPVILIVDGNLDISNSVTIYGFIYNMDATNTVLETNSVTINGALASTDNVTFTNSSTLNYNTSILNALPSIGGGGSSNYAKVPASWRDF